MWLKSLRHCFLVSEMIGAECSVTCELVLMVVNLQTLGVPMALTSLPLVLSATFSMVLIPVIGFLNDKVFRTKTQKAFSLLFVNLIQNIGIGLVLLGNVMKLLESGEEDGVGPSVEPFNNFTTNFNDNNNISITTAEPTTTSFHDSMVVDSSSMAASQGYFDLRGYAIVAILGYMMNDSGYDTGSCFLKTFALVCTAPKDHPSVIVKAIVVSSIGGIAVTLLGAIGIGKYIAEGTSLDVNALNAAIPVGLSFVTLTITMVITIVTGLCWPEIADTEDDDETVSTTGGEGNEENGKVTPADKLSLFSTSIRTSRQSLFEDPSKPSQEIHHRLMSQSTYDQNSTNRDVVETIWQMSHSGAHSFVDESLTVRKLPENQQPLLGQFRRHLTKDSSRMIEITGPFQGFVEKLKLFLKTHRLRINLAMASFFGLFGLICFNIFSVNFVAKSIFHGDPLAKAGTELYDNYLKGVQAGSTGLLVFYISFVVGSTSQAVGMQKIGWWKQTAIIYIAFILVNALCVITRNEYVYYVTSAVNGQMRALMFTLPYILVCRVLSQDTTSANAGSDRGRDITIMAAMLPLSVCSACGIVGPLIEVLGDSGFPLMVSSSSAAVGLVLFAALRKY